MEILGIVSAVAFCLIGLIIFKSNKAKKNKTKYKGGGHKIFDGRGNEIKDQ